MKSFFAVLSLLVFSPGARAQIMWDVTRSDAWLAPDLTVDTQYFYSAVSCFGNNCTVAATVYDVINPKPHYAITFYRSTDGGVSWRKQVPNVTLPAIITNRGITKIQQIDSLNVVGIGDSGVVLRTFDGGKTWEKQPFPSIYKLADVHFSDPMTGIISAIGAQYQLYITSDGGRHWHNAPFPGVYLEQCHSYGNGMFRFFKYGWGPIYTTYDNFKTVDSTKPVFDSLTDPKWYRYLLARCTFGGGDTILAYSKHWPADTVDIFGGNGMIMRSVDGGKHWEKPFIYPTTIISQIDYTTPLDRDTVYAGGMSNSYFLMSTNKGETWKADSILIDTSYMSTMCFGLSITSDGHPISIFSFAPFPYLSILTRGQFQKAHVEVIERIIYYSYLYPNPTSGLLNIQSIDKSKAPIRIIDIFGRECMRGALSDQGKLTLDLSRVSRGIYDVLLDHYGKVFSIGKIAVIGK